MDINEINVECLCTADCPRHGKCWECVPNHRNNPNKPLPHCLRPENIDKYGKNK